MNGREGGTGGIPNNYQQLKTGLELYDLKNDVGETNNVMEQFPDVVKRLQELAEVARDDLGDTLTKRKGNGIRPAGKLK